MAGEVDYLLRVVVPDIEAYDAFYKRLIAKIDISRRVDCLRHGADQIHDRSCRSTIIQLDKEKASERLAAFALAPDVAAQSALARQFPDRVLADPARGLVVGRGERLASASAGACSAAERLPIWRSAQFTAFLTKLRSSAASRLDERQEGEELSSGAFLACTA